MAHTPTAEEYQKEYQKILDSTDRMFADLGRKPNNVEYWREVYRRIHEAREEG